MLTRDIILPFVSTLAITVTMTSSARILGVFPLGAASHYRFTHPVMRTLAEAGHEVIIYSSFPELFKHQNSNITHIHLENVAVVDKSDWLVDFVEQLRSYPFWKCLDLYWQIVEKLYNDFINDKEVQKLLSSNEKFDLIVTEQFDRQEFTLLLHSKFKVPVIGLLTFPSNNILNSFSGNSLSLSYIPDHCTPFTNHMLFSERLKNAFASLRGLYYNYNYYLPRLEQIMRKDFPSMPPLLDLSKSVSLVFVNDHLTADYAQPRTPNIIPVAGIHIQPSEPLPKNLQKFLDEATDGVIFFSLGTYVPDEYQPKKYFDTFINVFKKLKQRVLWKTRKEDIEGLPSNVMTVKWAPQQSILAHPKCVLFITHGGQLSRVEAIHFGVPVVAIPQFFDQNKNSAFYPHKRVGVKINHNEVNEESLYSAIRKILDDKSYKENMQRLSVVFRDRPLSPAESVVFWTEYVLRHGGAAHLRPASTELRWYQLVLLDVFALILVIFIASITFLYVIFKAIYNVFRKKNTIKMNKKTN